MAKTQMKNRIKKMKFQRQERQAMEPLSENDKYIIRMVGYKKDTLKTNYENIYRSTRGTPRPQHI
jgi:hypothetical protein